MSPSAYSCECGVLLVPYTVTEFIEPSALNLCGADGTRRDKRGSNASLPRTTEALRVRELLQQPGKSLIPTLASGFSFFSFSCHHCI